MSSHGRIIVRNRPSLSCYACRRRKIKCEKQRPACASCIKYHDTCAYDDGSGSDPRRTLSRTPSYAKKRKVTPDPDAVEHSDSNLTSSDADGSHDIAGPPSHPPSCLLSPLDGYRSSAEEGPTLYVEGTFWALVCPDRVIRDSVLQTSAPPQKCRAETVNLLGGDSHRSLPSKQICNAILQAYFISVHPLVPVLHPPTFMSEYARFQSRLEGDLGNIVPESQSTSEASFTALVWCLLFAGMSAIAGTPLAASLKLPDSEECRERFYVGLIQAISAADFPQVPTIYCLASMLILHFGFEGEELWSLRRSHILAFGIRAAHHLGLHRETREKSTTSDSEELGRRLWWLLTEMDVQTSAVAGAELQAASSRGPFATRMPAHLKDSSAFTGDMNNTHSAYLLFAVGRAEVAFAMQQIIQRAYGHEPPSHQEFVMLTNMLEGLRGRIAQLSLKLPATGSPEQGVIAPAQANLGPHTHWTLYEDDTNSATIFNFFARSALHMLYLRVAILLQKRFIIEPAGLEQQHIWDRTAHICCEYIRCYLRLSQTPALSIYRWFLQSQLLPLQETLILLTHLRQQPSIAESDPLMLLTQEVMDACSGNDSAESPLRMWNILRDMQRKLPERSPPQHPLLRLEDYSEPQQHLLVPGLVPCQRNSIGRQSVYAEPHTEPSAYPIIASETHGTHPGGEYRHPPFVFGIDPELPLPVDQWQFTGGTCAPMSGGPTYQMYDNFATFDNWNSRW